MDTLSIFLHVRCCGNYKRSLKSVLPSFQLPHTTCFSKLHLPCFLPSIQSVSKTCSLWPSSFFPIHIQTYKRMNWLVCKVIFCHCFIKESILSIHFATSPFTLGQLVLMHCLQWMINFPLSEWTTFIQQMYYWTLTILYFLPLWAMLW